MPTIIQVNVQTGEMLEREMTAEEIAALPEPEVIQEQIAPIDPVEKLKQFIAANPDVMTVLKAPQ